MTKDEFKQLRAKAGHTQATLAREMNVHLRTVTRWEIGEVVIPRVVELALRYIARKQTPEALAMAKASTSARARRVM